MSEIIPECDITTMYQAEPTKMGKAEPERNDECGKAESCRRESELGNVDEGASGTIDDNAKCRAEPTKMGKAEQGRMETECGNVDGEKSGILPKYGTECETDCDRGMCRAEPTQMGNAEHENVDGEKNGLRNECGNVNGGTSGESLTCNVRTKKNMKSSLKKPSAKTSKNLQIKI